jgi:hypothetical protein
MVRNTPGGNDDYGAIGVALEYASYNEVSYNTFVNCLAPSYDYGTDGGAVEWWGNADGNYVHHNWANGNNGFLEVGGGSARDTIVAGNISTHNGDFAFIHLAGQFASVVQNFRIEQNTIVEVNGGWVIVGFEGMPTASTLSVRNNIFYAVGFSGIFSMPGFAHDHNLYFLGGGTSLGFTLGPTETLADPLFVNLGAQDFELQPQSPAINAGIDLGYGLDFANHPMPVGAAPDLGSYEYQSTH